MKSFNVTAQMKATDQYFPVVQCNILFKLVLPIEFLDKIQVCNYLKTTVHNVFFAEMKVKLSFIPMMHSLLLVSFNSRKCIWRTKNRFLIPILDISKSSLSLKTLCRLKMLLCY